MFKTDSKILKWMGNKYINEIVTKDLNRFLKELSVSIAEQVTKKSYAKVNEVKLDSNGNDHYLILRGNKGHKCKVREVIEIIQAHLENEFNIHTEFNLKEIRYGKRGEGIWEEYREFSALLKVI